MPEPSIDDVETFTQGRLLVDDPLTTMLLLQALAAVRRYCGWHVVGSVTETITIDGPGDRVLVMPTRHVTAIATIIEDASAVDVSSVTWSARGEVIKHVRRECWTSTYRGIAVTLTHGYDDAPNFNAAVLSTVDRLAHQSSGGEARVIGPFQYDTQTTANGFTDTERALLESYAIVPVP